MKKYLKNVFFNKLKSKKKKNFSLVPETHKIKNNSTYMSAYYYSLRPIVIRPRAIFYLLAGLKNG